MDVILGLLALGLIGTLVAVFMGVALVVVITTLKACIEIVVAIWRRV